MLRSMKSPQRNARVLSFQVDGVTPAINLGSEHATLTDNGTGDYTLTFAEPFSREPIVTGIEIVGDYGFCQVVSQSLTAVRISVVDTDGATALDAVINVQIEGYDSDDET